MPTTTTSPNWPDDDRDWFHEFEPADEGTVQEWLNDQEGDESIRGVRGAEPQWR